MDYNGYPHIITLDMSQLVKHKTLLAILFIGLLSLLVYSQALGAEAGSNWQIPTGSIPTVTGTPIGAVAIVLDIDQGYINVRAGPSVVDYDIVGVLIVGQEVPALGKSPGGDWIQIAYPGVPGGVAWVWADLVEVRGTLPVIEPPPTSTPRTTPTIDPTFAAQFLIEIQPTRLPTFTPPQPFTLPTLALPEQTEPPSRLPVGLMIIGLAVIGLFGMFLSVISGR